MLCNHSWRLLQLLDYSQQQQQPPDMEDIHRVHPTPRHRSRLTGYLVSGRRHRFHLNSNRRHRFPLNNNRSTLTSRHRRSMEPLDLATGLSFNFLRKLITTPTSQE